MTTKTKTTATKDEAMPALVPKLRFPEFRGTGAWKMSCFDEVLSPVVRERPKPAEAYLGLGLRSHGKGTFLKPLSDPAKNSMDQLYEVKTNDLIVNITFAWEGAVAIAQECDEGALVSHRFPTYTFEKGRTTPEFFRYVILDKQFIYNLGVISPGGAGRNRVLSKNDFLKLRVALPNPAEQQKIAECLSSLDELMAAQARKVDALKTHKKGLMQQLFPREGETQPRLRFPEFQNAGEWVTQTFATLYEFKPTNTFSRDQLNYESGPAKNIHYGDIHTKFSTLFRIEAETVPFVNSSESLSKLKADAYCQEGDMVFADASEDLADVGKSIELADLNGEKVLSGSHTILARQKKKGFIVGFAGHLFKGRMVRAQIEKEAQGTKVLQISPGRLAGIKVVFPENKAEQQRIASCLSSLDTLITAETQKLEALKIHKKGLMQQLFPTPEEVEA